MLKKFLLVEKMPREVPAPRNALGKEKIPPKEATNANLVETNQAQVEPRENPSKKDLNRDSIRIIHDTTRANRVNQPTTREVNLLTNII